MDDVENRIAELEQAEATAILGGDQGVLTTLWHPDYLVNAPHNKLTRSRQEVLDLVAAGIIAYHCFERVIEQIIVRGDTAVSMGHEIAQPKKGPQGGQTLTRRFSNIWQRQGDDWVMIARHANVVAGAGQNLDLPVDG